LLAFRNKLFFTSKANWIREILRSNWHYELLLVCRWLILYSNSGIWHSMRHRIIRHTMWWHSILHLIAIVFLKVCHHFHVHHLIIILIFPSFFFSCIFFLIGFKLPTTTFLVRIFLCLWLNFSGF
jgi:hypothetical protein